MAYAQSGGTNKHAGCEQKISRGAYAGTCGSKGGIDRSLHAWRLTSWRLSAAYERAASAPPSSSSSTSPPLEALRCCDVCLIESCC